MRLSDFTTLTFDCYGTLIDWERGIAAELIGLRQQGITLRLQGSMSGAVIFHFLMLAEGIIAGDAEREDGAEKNRTNDTRRH